MPDAARAYLDQCTESTLIGRSGWPGMLPLHAGEVLRPDRQTRSFNTFQIGPRSFRIGGGIGPSNFRVDPYSDSEAWKPIDLTVQPNILAGDDRWRMERCGYQVRLFPSFNGLPYACEYRRAGATLSMAPIGLFWRDALGALSTIRKPIAGLREEAAEGYGLWWPGAFGAGTAFGYDLRPDEFRKVVRIDKATDLPKQPLGATHLVIGMAIAWDGAAPASFAKQVTTAIVSDVDLKGLVSERLDDPAKFPALRADSKEAFWFGQPRAWDSSEEGRSWDLKWWIERRGAQVIAFFGLPAKALGEATFPLVIDTVMTEEPMESEAYDATARASDSTINNAAVECACGDLTSGAYDYMTGLVFTTVPIPAYAAIDSSAIKIKPSAKTGDIPQTFLAAQTTDSAAAFSNWTDWAARTWTAGVSWTPPAWVAGAVQTSTSLVTPLQAVISRPGWATNQNIGWKWYSAAGWGGVASQLRSYGRGTSLASWLNCEYTEGGGEAQTNIVGLDMTGAGSQVPYAVFVG